MILCLYVIEVSIMPKRVTILLDDSVYEAVVLESIRKYGTAKKISRVINEILGQHLLRKKFDDVIKLLQKPKKVQIDEEDFFKFRRELSKRLEG